MIFHSISGIYPFLLCFYFCLFVFCYVFSSNFPFCSCALLIKLRVNLSISVWYVVVAFILFLFCFITLSLGVFRHIVEKIWLALKFHFFLRTYWHFHFIELSQRHCSQPSRKIMSKPLCWCIFLFCFFLPLQEAFAFAPSPRNAEKYTFSHCSNWCLINGLMDWLI